MLYRDHGSVPLTRPEGAPQTIAPNGNIMIVAFVDMQVDYAFAIWFEGFGWRTYPYQQYIGAGRWLRGWSLCYHDTMVKLCLSHSAPNGTEIRHGFLSLDLS
jgi:hypothetical protein